MTADGIAGRRWNVVELEGTELVPGADETLPYLELDAAEGRVSGHGGCNRLSGSYELEGEKLRFGPVATTRMACAEDVMRREEAFLAALAATKRYQFDAGLLVLLDDECVLARLAAAAD